MIAQYAPYLMSAVLILAMALEFRTGKIPNWLTLIPFVLFIAVAATTEDRSTLVWPLIVAVAVFAVGLLLFAFAGFGAGAVKLMAGLALFIPLSKGFIAVGIFFGSLFVFGFVLSQIRKYAGKENSDWHILRSKSFPISLPLVLTGLGVFFVF